MSDVLTIRRVAADEVDTCVAALADALMPDGACCSTTFYYRHL